jgi:hypothetical protein
LQPNHREWVGDSNELRLAMNCAVSGNQMADWCLLY